MFPDNPYGHPTFVANQLLTAQHLNGMFNYLDEQESMTRTNLIGVGIVCGLTIHYDADERSIDITKGTAITTQGYLIAWPGMKALCAKAYNAVKPIEYNRFVDGEHQQKFPIHELLPSAVADNTQALSAQFLANKVVLMFVEMLSIDAKNCDPNGCDDKGATIEYTFKPLLVDESDAEALLDKYAGINKNVHQDYQYLPILRMPRFNVPWQSLVTTKDILDNYLKILNAGFFKELNDAFGMAYSALEPLIQHEFASNPLADIESKFGFIIKQQLNSADIVQIQYYYAFCADLVEAYNELRLKIGEVYAICLPEDVFPRHVLLGKALQSDLNNDEVWRHYFIPSPAIQNTDTYHGLLNAWKRLVSLYNNFQLQIPRKIVNKRIDLYDDQIKITPSNWGSFDMAQKAIPYYYNNNNGSIPLYQYWNLNGRHINFKLPVSYHANSYTNDDYFVNPLLYDIEKFNFFRIEGHIGKPYKHVIRQLTKLRKEQSLPFDMLALNANSLSYIGDIQNILTGGFARLKTELGEEYVDGCHFADIETQYDVLVADFKCKLAQITKFIYGITFQNVQGSSKTTVPEFPILKEMMPNYRIQPSTIGEGFELIWPSLASQPSLTVQYFLNLNNSTNPTTGINNGPYLVYGLLYYMNLFYKSLTASMVDFAYYPFLFAVVQMNAIADYLIAALSSNKDPNALSEEIIDQLNFLLHLCAQNKMTSLYLAYLLRWSRLIQLTKLGFFANKHFGLEHKGGVPKGGTFVLVYHQNVDVEEQVRLIIEQMIEEDLTLEDLFNNPAALSSATSSNSTSNQKGEAAAEAGKETATAKTNSESFQKVFVTATNYVREVDDKFTVESKLEERLSIGNILKKASRIDSIRATRVPAISTDLKTESQIDLDDELADITDGYVVADFYLPYVIKSNCPPVQVTVIETQQPSNGGTAPRLTLATYNYCNNDKNTYSISVHPVGGTIKGEGVSVQGDNFMFAPSMVNLGEEKQKVVIIEYTVEDQTVTIEVTVFAKPVANFRTVQGQNPLQVVFRNSSKHASIIEWDFGDGTTSSEENPTHDYKQEGSYDVTLKVTNSVCSDSASQTLKLETKPNFIPCTSLKVIVDPLSQLQSINTKYYPIFVDRFGHLSDMHEVFNKLMDMASPSEQLAYIKNESIDKRIVKWLVSLQPFIEASGSDNMLDLAMTGLGVIWNFIMYIACIKTKDFDDKDELDLSELINAMLSLFKMISASYKNYLVTIKLMVDTIANNTNAQVDCIISQGSEKTKSKYIKALRNIISMYESGKS